MAWVFCRGVRCKIVCRIHVRRTDKVGAEAAFHSIDEYMMHVEDYYDTLEKRRHVDRRRVYLATDDPSVISDAKRKSVLFFCYCFYAWLHQLYLN